MKKDICPNCGGKTYWFSGNEEVDAHGYCPQCMDIAYDEMGQAIGELTPEWRPQGGTVMNKNIPVKNAYYEHDEEEIVHEIKILTIRLNQALYRATNLSLKIDGHLSIHEPYIQLTLKLSKNLLCTGDLK